MVKALRSGIYAGYAIGDLLTRGDDTGLRRYRQLIRAEFESYAGAREVLPRRTALGPQSEFWERRRREEIAGG